MSVITTATSRRVMKLVSVLKQLYRSTKGPDTHEVSVMININIYILCITEVKQVYTYVQDSVEPIYASSYSHTLRIKPLATATLTSNLPTHTSILSALPQLRNCHQAS